MWAKPCMTQSSKTAQNKTIDVLLAALISTALVAGVTISVALYAGFEGFHRGELAVEQTFPEDFPPPLFEVRDDYEMVKRSYSLVAFAFLTALVLHLFTETRIINWITNVFIIGMMIGAAYQFKTIFWFKNAALGSDRPRFAFMRDTYSLDIVVCGAIVIAILSLLVKLFRTREYMNANRGMG
jgi:hypothetical protein